MKIATLSSEWFYRVKWRFCASQWAQCLQLSESVQRRVAFVVGIHHHPCLHRAVIPNLVLTISLETASRIWVCEESVLICRLRRLSYLKGTGHPGWLGQGGPRGCQGKWESSSLCPDAGLLTIWNKQSELQMCPGNNVVQIPFCIFVMSDTSASKEIPRSCLYKNGPPPVSVVF